MIGIKITGVDNQVEGCKVNGKPVPTYCGKVKVVMGFGWYERCGEEVGPYGAQQCKDCKKIDEDLNQ